MWPHIEDYNYDYKILKKKKYFFFDNFEYFMRNQIKIAYWNINLKILFNTLEDSQISELSFWFGACTAR